jgi:two-component system NtrC family response regulator
MVAGGEAAGGCGLDPLLAARRLGVILRPGRRRAKASLSAAPYGHRWKRGSVAWFRNRYSSIGERKCFRFSNRGGRRTTEAYLHGGRTSLSAHSDSILTNTAVDRSRRRDDARVMPALLVVGSAALGAPRPAERVIAFDQSLAVGRRPREIPEADAYWVIRDDLVSRHHCRIARAGDGWQIVDLGSRNGTAVDGSLLKETPTRLKDGSVICLGGYVAVFRLVTDQQLAAIRADMAVPLAPVATASPILALLTQKLAKLARSPGELLLTGETGVGKEVYARAVHEASGRGGRFVTINCAAIPRELIESELFGFARGAHSEAKSDKRGLFEEADGGTLFLDEIGDMPQELQAKLLRFLQDREITPLGSTRPRRIDVRVLSATSRSVAPTSPASAGLRPDLSARLGAEPIRIPPLRQRIEDLGALSQYLLRSRWKPFETMAFQALCLHTWPGNVRELAKVLEAAAVLAEEEDMIAIEHLPSAIAQTPERLRYTPHSHSGRPPPTQAELEALLRRLSGNIARVARELDRKPPLIYRWCRRYKLDPETFRSKA